MEAMEGQVGEVEDIEEAEGMAAVLVEVEVVGEEEVEEVDRVIDGERKVVVEEEMAHHSYIPTSTTDFAATILEDPPSNSSMAFIFLQ